MLLRKTELRIAPVFLRNVNLTAVAGAVAHELGLADTDVFVTDFRDNMLTLDVLAEHLDGRTLIGKMKSIIEKLGNIPGVTVSPESEVRSDGMLGWIAVEGEEAHAAMARSEEMIDAIDRNLSRRAIVFSTGDEVITGRIEDTNSPAIFSRLASEGYMVKQGGVLEDDSILIAGRLKDAVDNGGYRLVITTGGVGAEDKDRTIEAMMLVDPAAATPYICRFEVGTGRHVKDGIRIATARYSDALLIALPGPNDEVLLSLPVIVQCLKSKSGKEAMAERIAEVLREKWKNGMHKCKWQQP